jgi:hypothetical protein
VSANGFAGTVATATTTPAITLSTTITGLLKGNATAISAAVAGTDYQAPITLTTTGSSGAATFVGNTLNIPNYGSSGVALTVGTTTIASGTTTKVLFDNAGVLGEYTISGSGSVAMTTSPVFTTPSLGAATATTINGNTFTTGSYTITGTAAKTLTFQNSLTLAGTDATTMTFPSTSATIARTDAGQTFTGTQVFTSPTINGLPTGTGVASAATASTLMSRDSNANTAINNIVEGFTTTATAGATTTLTITSTYTQVFTGTLTQTVKLPTTSVLQGQQYLIINQSTGAVTVQSSGANTITILAAGTSATFTAVVATPTTAANWSSLYYGDIVASGKSLTVNNTLTFAGTDATTMTFPTTSKTIAANDGSNWAFASQAVGDIAYANAAGTYTRLAAVALGSVLTSAGVTTAPTWSSAPQITTIELGNASDTTLSRSAAGVLAVEGVVIPSISSTNTLTNKRVTRRLTTTNAPGATPTTNTDNVDIMNFTGVGTAITSMTTNLSGTPNDGDLVEFRFIDDGTARAITWGTSFAATTVALPTTTVISTCLRVLFEWRAASSKWECLATA